MTTKAKPSYKLLLALVIVAAGSGLMVRGQTPQAVGTWAASGAIATGRAGAASTTLDDGRTLISGGAIAGTATASVIIYDPADNSSASAGQLTSARVGHTATLLEDGRVLIAGGAIAGAVSADLEVFNPADGTSVLVGTMSSARAGHGEAHLADGTVLLVGGSNGTAALASAEVFDPNTSESTAVGSMAAARSGVSATRLIDNRVLVAGGYNGSTDLASAEIFSPFTQTFDAVPTTLGAARSGHSAILLPHNNGVLIAGGTSAGVPVVSSDLFLPAQFPDPYSYGIGQFVATGAMTVARANAASGPATEGFAFVAGGGSDDAERYRFATIKTNQDDYAPGELAVITGSGWQPNEIVTLRFQEDPAVHDDYVLEVQADINGDLFWNQWSPEQHDIGVRFYLLASGAVSKAQTTFTDNVRIVRATTVSPVTVTITALSYSGSETCTGSSVSLGSFPLTSASVTQITNSNSNGRSVKLTAPATATSPAGYNFSNWTSPTSGPFTPVIGEPGAICIRGSNGNQDQTYTPNYTAPTTATLNVIKHVVNDNGGTATAANWMLTVSSTDGGTGTGSATGLESPGTTYTVQAGKTYNVNESGGPAGYAESKSADCTNLVPTAGSTYTCTITNDDIVPKLTVTKVVVNDHGGTKGVADFPLFVDGSPVTSGVQGTFNAGTRTVSETGMSTYAATISGDCAPDGTITLALAEVKTCIITNDDIAPTLTVIKHVVNDNGGTATADNWTLSVTSSNGGAGTGSAQGAEAPGTPYTIEANKAYSVTESGGPPGYAASSSADCTIANAVLATNYACTITNDDIAPTLTVVKNVVNDHGGTALAAAWTLTVTSSNSGSGTGSAPGEGAPGTVYTIEANKAYAVTESGGPATGYAASLSPDCTIANAVLATSYTCTITNDDIQPKLFVIKHVVNDNGGTAVAGAFTMTVTGTDVGPSSFAGEDSPGTEVGLDAGTYSVTETGPAGYARSDSADCSGSIAIGETKTCTVTNDDIAPTLTVIKHVVNDHGGTAAAAAWTLSVTSSNGGAGTGSNAGAEAPGTLYTIAANRSYAVNESGGPSGYAETKSADCTIANTVLATDYVCTITNDDIQPRLYVIKTVVNDNGGTAVAANFTMSVTGTDVSPASFPGEGAPGTLVGLDAGNYSVSETGPFGYARSDSADCTGSIAIGQTKTCTITNDDIQPKLYVIKHVVNDNGGNAVASNFTMTVTGTNVSPASFPGQEAPGTLVALDAGTYSVSETGLGFYARTDSADCAGSIGIGQTKTCTVTNDDLYEFIGFFEPVENLKLNGVTAGRAIPLKWELRNAAGVLVLNLSVVTGITYGQIQCGIETVDPMEYVADDSGFSELRLTATGYHFNWKTEKGFANKCYEIRIALDDDSVHTAKFKFKR